VGKTVNRSLCGGEVKAPDQQGNENYRTQHQSINIAIGLGAGSKQQSVVMVHDLNKK